MSLTLHLGLDDEIASCTRNESKSFMDEIIAATYPDYFRPKRDKLLTPEERRLLYPDYCPEDDDLARYRKIDPLKLQLVFKKLYYYLRDNHQQLPLIHFISEHGKSSGDITERFHYKGYECYLDGFHNDFQHRDEISIRCSQKGWEALEWIKAAPEIRVADKIFRVKTLNKFEEFKDILQELMNICEQGIKANRKLIWVFST